MTNLGFLVLCYLSVVLVVLSFFVVSLVDRALSFSDWNDQGHSRFRDVLFFDRKIGTVFQSGYQKGRPEWNYRIPFHFRLFIWAKLRSEWQRNPLRGWEYA